MRTIDPKPTSTSVQKATLAFSIFALLLFVFPAKAQMREMFVDNTETDNDIHKIAFYSGSTGYVAFTDWVGFTTDSGRTFLRKYIGNGNVNYNGYPVNLTFGFGISGVTAFNADTVIVYGNYGYVPSILYSTDSGNTYLLVYQSSLNAEQLTGGIMDMVFPKNTATGFAVEADRIIKTTNRGKSWGSVLEAPNSFFNFLEPLDDNTVFAFGGTKLMMTSNAGASWSAMPVPPGTQINYAFFLTPTKGWINMQDNGGLYYTANGGAAWIQQNSSVINPFYANKMHFINDSTGFATGDGYTVLKSSDSGKIWEPLPRNNNYSYLNYSLTDLHFQSTTQFWAGGGQGFLEMSTDAGGLPIPRAYFTIDTSGLSQTGTVNLVDHSKAGYQYSWYRNNTLIATSYNASYIYNLVSTQDTIKLIISNASGSDTLIVLQAFIPPPSHPAPVITGFTPDTAVSGTIITISGNYFTGTTAVSFGGIPASSFIVVSDSVLNAVVASGASGAVSVTTPDGTGTKGEFVFTTRLSITSFTPAYGSVGTVVTINGSNFSPVPANNIVFFGASKATVLMATTNQITVSAPAGATYVPLSVTVGGLTAYASLPFVLSFPGGGNIRQALFPGKTDFPGDVGAFYIATSDFDGDGKVDIAMGNYDELNRINILKNTSTTDSVSFVQEPYLVLQAGYDSDGELVTGDVDGDGKPDVIASNAQFDPFGFSVFRNTSTGGTMSFAPPINFTTGPGSGPTQILLCDFDQDGRPDVFGPTGAGIRIYQNTGSIGNLSFNLLPTSTLSGNLQNGQCATGDIDGDGKPDLIVSTTGGFYIFRNTSNAGVISFATPAIIPLPTGMTAVATTVVVADLDGDKKPDLAVRTQDATISILLNLSTPGNIAFAPNQDFQAINSIYNIAAADLNGDGKVDLAAAVNHDIDGNNNTVQITVWQNNSTPGNIAFANGVGLGYTPATQSSYNLTLADFNGDGIADIASVDNSQNFSILLAEPALVQITRCAGDTANLVSNITGTTYQWQLDKDSVFSPIANDTIFAGTDSAVLHLENIPASWNGYSLRCFVDGAYSKTFQLLISPAGLNPVVTITTPDSVTCMGSPVTLTATTVNGGASPAFQWTINGNFAPGGNSSTYSSSQFMDSDRVQVLLTSDASCLASQQASSNIITLKINPYVSPSVYLSLSDTSTECSGTPLTFTATAVNGGTSPTFIWFVNGQVGPGIALGPSYTISTLHDGDQVGVRLVSSAQCMTNHNPEANSTTITVNVTGGTAPSVSIAASSTDICTGMPVQFTASASNAGTSSSYQWYKDGTAVESNSGVYVDSSLNNGDIVGVILQTNSVCSDSSHPARDSIQIMVNPIVTPGIAITGNDTINQGKSSLVSTTATNAGNAPVYQWQDSTSAHGWQSLPETTDTINYSAVSTGDALRCLLTGDAPCATQVSDTSGELVFVVQDSGNTSVPDTSSIRFFPNPAQSVLNVNGLRLVDQWQSLEIITIEGVQKLFTSSVAGQTNMSIHTGQLSAGMYVIILRGPKGSIAHFKLIKM